MGNCGGSKGALGTKFSLSLLKSDNITSEMEADKNHGEFNDSYAYTKKVYSRHDHIDVMKIRSFAHDAFFVAKLYRYISSLLLSRTPHFQVFIRVSMGSLGSIIWYIF